MMSIKITDVRHLKGDAAFLIDDGETSILYDTGFGFTGYRVAENIRAVLGERPLDYIFLTHSHYDHALGSPYILRHYPTAKVVAGSYAAGIFRRDGAKRTMKELDGKFAEKCGYGEYEFLGDELRVDIAVNDGDVIDAGKMQFRVIALPGHTRCCVGYYCKETGLLLSNETLGVYDGEETVVPSYLVSYADTLASIERIEGLDITSVVAPHYGLLDRAQTEFYLSHMRSAAVDTANELLCCIKRGMSDSETAEQFKKRFWHGYIREIYPEDAMVLNTSIMIRLLKSELM